MNTNEGPEIEKIFKNRKLGESAFSKARSSGNTQRMDSLRTKLAIVDFINILAQSDDIEDQEITHRIEHETLEDLKSIIDDDDEYYYPGNDSPYLKALNHFENFTPGISKAFEQSLDHGMGDAHLTPIEGAQILWEEYRKLPDELKQSKPKPKSLGDIPPNIMDLL